MFDFLVRAWRDALHLGEDAVAKAGALTTGLIATVLSALTRSVAAAWSTFARVTEDWALTAATWIASVTSLLARIVTFDIPHYAMTAWWWVTHPEQLAEQISWWVVRFLEVNAWTAARYLGEFMTALLLAQLRTFVRVVELILEAVL